MKLFLTNILSNNKLNLSTTTLFTKHNSFHSLFINPITNPITNAKRQMMMIYQQNAIDMPQKSKLREETRKEKNVKASNAFKGKKFNNKKTKGKVPKNTRDYLEGEIRSVFENMKDANQSRVPPEIK
ncbi:hypothetical protein ABK040_007544 [Willaertia magna]